MVNVSGTLLGAIVLVGSVCAQQCATPTVRYAHQQVVQKEVIVKKEVVVPVIAPVAVYAVTPAYAAVYVPGTPAPAPTPAPASAPPAPSGELQQVLSAIQGVHTKVDALDARLKAVEGRAPDKPTPDKPDPFAPRPQQSRTADPAAAMKTLVQAKCVQCHATATAADKGGGFVLVEGEALAKLDDRQMRKVLSLSYSGRMPPRSSSIPALTDEEVAVVAAWVETAR